MTAKRIVSLLLIFLLTLGFSPALLPMTASAASQFITDIQLTSVTTSSAEVSFHYGKKATDDDYQIICITLYDEAMNYQSQKILKLTFSEGEDFRGDYTHTFTNLTPETAYYARIGASAGDKKYHSDNIPITTPAVGTPAFELEVSGVKQNSFRLSGRIISTGTGHTVDPAGNIYNPANETIISQYKIIVTNSSGQIYAEGFSPYSSTSMFNGASKYINVGGVIKNPYNVRVTLVNRHGAQGFADSAFRFFVLPMVTDDQMSFSAYSPQYFGGSLALGVAADSYDELLSVSATRAGSGETIPGVFDPADELYKWYFDQLEPEETYLFYIDALCKSGPYMNIAELAYTTPPVPCDPTVTTGEPAEYIKSDGAKLSGQITDNGGSNIQSCGFVYATLESGNNDPDTLVIGGIGVTQKAAPVVTQELPADFSVYLKSLPAETGYYYRAYAKNTAGLIAYGGIETFSTLPAASVTTVSHSDVETDSATLTGNVISTGNISPTIRGFVLSRQNDPQLGGEDVLFTIDEDFSAGTGSYSTDAIDLVPDTTYYYRAYIHNAKGTFYGDTENFTTEAYEGIPTVKLGLVSPPQTEPYSKEVNATFTAPAGVTVTAAGFVYAETEDPVIDGAGVQNVQLDDVDGSFEATLTDLSPGTTYYYKAYATDGTVTGYSNQGQFTTIAQPTTGYSVPVVTRTEVTEVTAASATVETVADFSGTGPALFGRVLYYSQTNDDPRPGGASVTSVPAGALGMTGEGLTVTDINGLDPETTYYLRCVTDNPQGQYFGSVVTFVTDEAGLPIVENADTPYDDVTHDGAVVYADIKPNGSDTDYGVVYSFSVEDPTLDSAFSTTCAGSGTIEVNDSVFVDLTGLLYGSTTYYYRFYAENSKGITYSDVQNFTTLTSDAPQIPPPTNINTYINEASVDVSVSNDGSNWETLTRLGVLFGTDSALEITDPAAVIIYSDYTAPGTMTFTVGSLEPDTDYYARPFGITQAGTVHYGEPVPFKTMARMIPVVEEQGFFSHSANTAELFGNVIEDGGSDVIERGFVYAASPEPEIGGPGVTKAIDSGFGAGEFSVTLSGLEEDTVYYARAYAVNDTGTAYSDDLIFIPDLPAMMIIEYTVTFDGNGAASGTMLPQNFTEGIAQQLTDNAFTRPNYTFEGWATTPAGAVLYTDEETVTINVDMTLYAVWKHAGSGGGSSGGGGGAYTPAQTDQVENGIITVSSVTTDGTAAGTVNAEDAAIAVSQAAAAGSSAVTFLLDASDDAKGAQLKVPADVFSTVLSSQIQNLIINTPIADIVLDQKAIRNIAAAAKGSDVIISASLADPGALSVPEDVKAEIARRPLYDFAITSGNKTITSLGGGQASVRVPYTLKPGENPNAIVVYYLDNNGRLQNVPGVYHAGSCKVSMMLSHFSIFVVGYNKIQFTDVPDSAWYANAVDFAASRNLFGGVGNEMFAPAAPMTRAMFAQVLSNLEGADLSAYKDSRFTDVSPAAWFAPAVAWAAEKNIISGYSNGNFGPEDEITREQMAVMLYRYMQYKGIEFEAVNDTPFGDEAAVSAWAKGAVGKIRSYGIIGGVGGNKYAPFDNAQRSQVAQIFKNYVTTYVK